MEMQRYILKKYFEVYQKPTLKFISLNTGIQMTRVFRILNGSEMRLSEYEKFQRAIQNSQFSTLDEREYFDLMRSSYFQLSGAARQKMALLIKRKIKLKTMESSSQQLSKEMM